MNREKFRSGQDDGSAGHVPRILFPCDVSVAQRRMAAAHLYHWMDNVAQVCRRTLVPRVSAMEIQNILQKHHADYHYRNPLCTFRCVPRTGRHYEVLSVESYVVHT